MKAALIPLTLLAGCATYDETVGWPTGPCRVDEQARMRFAGTEFKQSMRDELQRATNSRVARVLRSDDAATMDMQPDRLNIELDDGDRISGLRCG